VILDRDGVINEDSDAYIKSPQEWVPIEGSIEAIADLHVNGYKVVVATNQSGLARNLFDEFELAKIHQKMCSVVEEAGGFIDGIFFCPHGPDENCGCRKPKTGLLEAIAEEFDISLEGVPFIGDSLKDVQAAKAAKCFPILVQTGKGNQTLAAMNDEQLQFVSVVPNLQQAVLQILSISDS
jgi:D-glycero-D-manno-heptose 1,7-bisphosphate phosphatase